MDNPCAPATVAFASDRRPAPSCRATMLAMPDDTMAESANNSMETGNIKVTAASASGPTKTPSSIASTTVRSPLVLVKKTTGSAVRRRTFAIGSWVNPWLAEGMRVASLGRDISWELALP